MGPKGESSRDPYEYGANSAAVSDYESVNDYESKVDGYSSAFGFFTPTSGVVSIRNKSDEIVRTETIDEKKKK